MNYGVKATKKRIRAANSRKKKYANRLFLTFFKTAFVLVLFLCVTGVSTFIGMFKGILDSSPDFNPDSFTPSGYFSTIYNSAGGSDRHAGRFQLEPNLKHPTRIFLRI